MRGGPELLFPLYFIPYQSRIFSVAYRKKGGKTGKTGKNRKKTEKPEKTGKTEKTGKNRKRREKGSQNIKACRIENTLKLVTSP
jgi:hypothetical protein